MLIVLGNMDEMGIVSQPRDQRTRPAYGDDALVLSRSGNQPTAESIAELLSQPYNYLDRRSKCRKGDAESLAHGSLSPAELSYHNTCPIVMIAQKVRNRRDSGQYSGNQFYGSLHVS